MAIKERRLGILAGGGKLPREIADLAVQQGLPVQIVAIDSEADGDFSGLNVVRVNWGGIGRMIRVLKDAGVTDLVIVGHVRRPEIGALKPDLGFFRQLPRLLKIVASGGDDSVLRRVVRFFEQQGFRVVGPGEAAPELVVQEGSAGGVRASDADQEDIRLGLDLIRALGPFDVGQGVIVSGGRIEAIEGVEGTDRMIARAGALRDAGDGSRRGVLVKRSKPEQDLRVDMPAIGPATVEGADAARLAGIAVEAGKVLIADRALALEKANAAGVFIEGVRDASGAWQLGGTGNGCNDGHLTVLGGVRPQTHAVDDAMKGLRTVTALERFDAGATTVVVRKHVLAVEADDGAEATITRAAGLRQWASLTRRRRGVAVVRHAATLSPRLVTLVANAGYAGLAVGDGGAAVTPDVVRAADAAGLFVAAGSSCDEALS